MLTRGVRLRLLQILKVLNTTQMVMEVIRVNIVAARVKLNLVLRCRPIARQLSGGSWVACPPLGQSQIALTHSALLGPIVVLELDLVSDDVMIALSSL